MSDTTHEEGVYFRREDYAGVWRRLLIGGARIVNLQGKAPGLFPLTIRLAFATIGPINVIIDLFWITGDENRQALRDKFAGTYVINRDAKPLGRGKIMYRNYLMFFNFLVREVQRPGSATISGSDFS